MAAPSYYEANPQAFEHAHQVAQARDFLFPPGSVLHGLAIGDPDNAVSQRAKQELWDAAERLVQKGVRLG